MSRREQGRKSGLAGRIFGIALINIVPIAGLSYAVWLIASGRKSLADLPEGVGRTAAYLGIAIMLLVIFASVLLPLVHGTAKGMGGRLRYSAEMRRQGGALRKLWEWLLWPFRFVLWLLAAILRLGLVLLCFALVAAAIFFIVRLFEPTVLEEQLRVDERVQAGIDWLRARIAR